MPNYKIVASDLDGTLLDKNAQISRQNRAAIAELLQKGIQFVPSSGRTMSEMPSPLVSNADIRYYIYSNGAAVIDTHTGKRILMCISKPLAARVLDIVYSYKTHLTVRQNGECYVDARCQKPKDYRFYNVCDRHSEVLNEFAVFKQHFKSFVYSLDNIEVLSVFFHSIDEMKACQARLDGLDGVIAAESWYCNLEIFSSAAGKGSALLALADMLGVDRSQTIGVGDSGNDLTLVKDAGLGLAVQNAGDALKAVADKIICDNERHAIKYIVDNII